MSTEPVIRARAERPDNTEAARAPNAAALANKTIVVTRAPEQSHEFIALLEARGAKVLSLPMIRFEEPDDTVLLDAGLRALDRIDWIIFTSANAVHFTAKRAAALQVLPAARARRPQLKIAAVGPATARALETEGLWVDYIANNHNAAALAAELQDEIRDNRLLLPRTNMATADLPRALREHAAQVIEVVAYKTVLPGAASAAPIAGGRIRGDEPPPTPEALAFERVRANDIDLIAFASPSAFHNFTELIPPDALHQLSQSNRFAAIGPTTAQAIRDSGCAVAIEAQKSTAEGLAEAIAACFSAPEVHS